MKAKLIQPNGHTTEVAPKNGKDFSLEELQGFVDGYIECVYLDSKTIMVINEEGKLNGLPYNHDATVLSGLYPHDVIVGPALICSKKQIK